MLPKFENKGTITEPALRPDESILPDSLLPYWKSYRGLIERICKLKFVAVKVDQLITILHAVQVFTEPDSTW